MLALQIHVAACLREVCRSHTLCVDVLDFYDPWQHNYSLITYIVCLIDLFLNLYLQVPFQFAANFYLTISRTILYRRYW